MMKRYILMCLLATPQAHGMGMGNDITGCNNNYTYVEHHLTPRTPAETFRDLHSRSGRFGKASTYIGSSAIINRRTKIEHEYHMLHSSLGPNGLFKNATEFIFRIRGNATNEGYNRIYRDLAPYRDIQATFVQMVDHIAKLHELGSATDAQISNAQSEIFLAFVAEFRSDPRHELYFPRKRERNERSRW